MFPARAASSHQNKPWGAAPPPRPWLLPLSPPPKPPLAVSWQRRVNPSTSARATLYDVVVLRVVPRCQIFAALFVSSGLRRWLKAVNVIGLLGVTVELQAFKMCGKIGVFDGLEGWCLLWCGNVARAASSLDPAAATSLALIQRGRP